MVVTQRAAVAALLFVAVGACVDKALLPERDVSSQLALQFVADVATGGRVVDVAVTYDRTNNERVAVAALEVDVAGSDVSVTVPVDLTECLADPAHAGGAETCRLRVAVALRDSVAIPIDSVELGPFDARPGRAPVIPNIELGVQRFGVHRWVGDDALQLGGTDGPHVFGTISGYVGGAGAATPVAINNVTNASGQFVAGALYAFENGQWRRLTTFPSGVQDVSAISATDMWVAANAGLYRFDGTAAARVTAIPDSLITVAARAVGGGVFVVAGGQQGAIWTGNGTTWTRHTFTTDRVRDACVNSPTEAYVASLEGRVYRFDGAAWTQTPTFALAPKSGLQCPEPGTAFVYDTLSLHRWTGAAWGTQSHPYPGQGIRIVWAANTANELFATGTVSTTVGLTIGASERAYSRFNGTAWQEIGRTAFANTSAFNPVWADPRGGAAVLASSGFGRLDLVTPNSLTVASYQPALRDISMSSPDNAVAVGWNLFLARWNGTRWTVDAPPPPASVRRTAILHGAWTDGPANAWAVGPAPIALHWTGQAWNTVISGAATQFAGMNAVWGAGNTVFLAGTQVARCVNEACALESAPTAGAELISIWGSSLQNVFAVGTQGRILRYDGQAWAQMASPTTRTLRRVWGSGPTNVWALGDSVLIRFDGTAWLDVPMTGDLAQVRTGQSSAQSVIQIGLWGTGPNDVYVGGDGGRIARFDGATWRLMQAPTARRILAISGVASGGAIAVGDAQLEWGGPTLIRGVSAGGTMSATMGKPIVWY